MRRYTYSQGDPDAHFTPPSGSCQDTFNVCAPDGETFSEWLALCDFEVSGYCTEHQDGQDVLHLWCVHQYCVAVCPRCHTLSQEGHDTKARCVRDLDIGPWRVLLHFRRRRFACGRCKRPFTERLADLDERRRATRRFEQRIYQRCLSASHQQVAQQEWLHPATVTDIFQRFAKQQCQGRRAFLARHLCIDEIALRRGHKQYVLVLSDSERRCVLAVLPDRRQETLEDWLDALLEEQRQAIQSVCIDRWEPYRNAVRAQLPPARLVIDRFHVMGQLNERLTQRRRRIQAQAPSEEKTLLKGSRWLLVKNRSELTAQEEAQLSALLQGCSQLRTLYLLKEEFRTIFEKVQEREKAARFLKAWICKALYTGNSFLLKFVNTLQNWWPYILNYFVERRTNGFAEGINRAIRNLIQRAFGYRNFDNFRLQVLAQQGDPAG